MTTGFSDGGLLWPAPTPMMGSAHGATLTHCPYCYLQCGVSMLAGRGPATLLPQPDFPTNRGGLTNEKAYQFGNFARVALRTSAIDYNGRFCMPSSATAGNRAFDTGRANGAVHMVVDPRRTATAAGSAVHLAARPGTDLALANGLLHLAVNENLIDQAYIDTPDTGFDAGRAAVAASWPASR